MHRLATSGTTRLYEYGTVPDIAQRSNRAHAPGTAFRVLIAGGRHFTDYPALRATLETLAHRLPDVELLTVSGRGVPMPAGLTMIRADALTAGIATEVTTRDGVQVLDFHSLPGTFATFLNTINISLKTRQELM